MAGVEASRATEAGALIAADADTRIDIAAKLEPEFERQFRKLLDATPEGAAVVFLELATKWGQGRRMTATQTIILGSVLSRLSKGSLAHSRLLSPSHVNDVRPLLWYGWFDSPLSLTARNSRISIPVVQKLFFARVGGAATRHLHL